MMEERAVMGRKSGTPQEDPEELVDLETIQPAPMVSPTIQPIPIPATIQSTQIQDQAVPTQTPQTTTQPQTQQIVELEDEEMGGTLPQNNAHTHETYA
jgi:hypothetical protein